MNQYSAILDIGSSKIICLICSPAHGDGLVVHGAGICEYKGYRHGVFAESQQLEESIANALNAAEAEAKHRIRDIAVSVPAPFSLLHVSDSWVDVRASRIGDADIEALLNKSLEFDQPKGYHLIHSTPISFSLDGAGKLDMPIGSAAKKLGAKVSHVYVQGDFKRSVDHALEGAGLEADIYVSVPLAAGLFLIPAKDRMEKALLIDVGHTHTDVSLVRNAALMDFRSLDVGGTHFTGDLAYGLRIPWSVAENVKRRYVYSLDYQDSIDIIRIPDAQAIRVDHEVVQYIVEERTKELAALIMDAAAAMDAPVAAGLPIYLTGGGLSLMRGSCEFLERYMGVSIHVNMPWMPRLSSPNYASAYAVMDFVLHADDPESGGMKLPGKKNRWVKKLVDFFTK